MPNHPLCEEYLLWFWHHLVSLSLLFSRINTPSSLCRFSQDLCSRPLISLVAFLWTFSSSSMFFLNWGGPKLDTALEVQPNQC